MTGTRLALCAWVLMSFADGYSLGTYGSLSLAVMCLGVLLLSLPAALPRTFPLTPPSRVELGLALGALVVLHPAATIEPANERELFRAAAVIFVGMLLAIALLPWSRHLARIAGAVGVLCCCAAGAYMVSENPDPHVDVVLLTQGAADSVVHGFNMYLGHWEGSTGIEDGFPYLPGVGLLLAPLAAVGQDVRYGLVLLSALSAVAVWRFAPRERGPWLALMVLAVPGWPSLVTFAWNEPLLLLPLALVLALVKAGRVNWAVVALVVALATKQHVLLLCPVLAAWPAFGLRRVVVAVGSAAAIVLPWFLAAPHAFLDGALWLNLHLPPRPDSLSLFSYALDLGWRPPFALVAGTTLLALGWSVVQLRRPTVPAHAALTCAWVLAVFHLVNKQSFYNEWWLVIALVVVALALTDTEDAPAAAPA